MRCAFTNISACLVFSLRCSLFIDQTEHRNQSKLSNYLSVERILTTMADENAAPVEETPPQNAENPPSETPDENAGAKVEEPEKVEESAQKPEESAAKDEQAGEEQAAGTKRHRSLQKSA